MILRALDLITIVVPPALPATLSIGTSFAIGRLKKLGIFCISPPRVNIGGKIDCMCFDKTGTLTEDGLDIHGIRAIMTTKDGRKFFDKEYKSIQSIDEAIHDDTFESSTQAKILRTMTTCHSLKIVSGELLGDPLDLKMFEFTRWELEESGGASSMGLKPRSELAALQAKKSAKVGIMPTVVRPPGVRQDMNMHQEQLVNIYIYIYIIVALTHRIFPLNRKLFILYRTQRHRLLNLVLYIHLNLFPPLEE